MNLLNKLTIKNLKLNKKRSIVTIIGIILSVALITALSSLYASFLETSIKYETSQKGNYHVGYKDVPNNEIETIKNNTKIETTSIVENLGYAKLENCKNEAKPYAYIKALDEKAFQNLCVKLIEGRLPENENEIVIPEHLKYNGKVNLKIGEEITLDIGTRKTGDYELNQDNPFSVDEEKIVDTKTKTYKIVGIVERPITTIEPISAPGYTFITFLGNNITSEKVDIYTLYNKKGINDYIKVTSNILEIDENTLKKALDGSQELSQVELTELSETKYKTSLNTYLIALQTNPFSISSNKALGYMAGFVCIIIIVTSVFCIKNSFDISITEKVKQYGMFKSIGATKKQIKKNVLFEAFILGTIGIPLGIISGLFASFILVYITNILLAGDDIIAFKLCYSFSILAIIFSIILGIITIYFSAIKSARKASKVTPIESIRNSGNIKIKNKKLRTPKIIDKLFGIGGVISLKNLKRNKKKYRTTVISLTVSISTFIALFYTTSEMKRSIQNDFVSTNYNYYYITSQVNPNDKNEIKEIESKIEQTTKIEGIKKYSVIKNASFTVQNPKFNKKYIEQISKNYTIQENESAGLIICCIQNNEYEEFLKQCGLKYDEMKNKAIMIDDYKYISNEKDGKGSGSLRMYNYNIGDKITGEIYNNEQQIPFTIEIGYVSTDKFLFAMENGTYNVLIVSNQFFEENNLRNDYYSVYFDTSDVNNHQSKVQEIFKDTEISDYNIDKEKKQLDNVLLLINIFLYGFIIVISLIGITNVFNTITTNMELRKPEFAMLKSIGMTKKEFAKMINLESIFMGGKALLYGILIGCGLSYIIYIYTMDWGTKFNLPIIPIGISGIIVFILITSLMRYSIRKINKQNTIETIRNENI